MIFRGKCRFESMKFGGFTRTSTFVNDRINSKIKELQYFTAPS